MRAILLTMLLTGLLSACTYGAKSEILLGGAGAERSSAELQRLVNDLSQHRSGCFASQVAELRTTREGLQEIYRFLVDDSAIELAVQRDAATGGITITLNEWVERRFTAKASHCYKQLVKRLADHYGRDRLTILESCDGPCVR